MAPTLCPADNGPPQQGASTEGSLPTSKDKAPSGDSSVYNNFRRWQHFKTLARRHLPQSPDAEALACFLIPVLRTLAQRKPSMPLDDGMRIAMREWQHKSNFDRMIYYEMAEKFTEFEAEEEIQIQNLGWKKENLCQPPPTPQQLAPPGPPSPVALQQPEHARRKNSSKALPNKPLPQRHQASRERTPKEIPPEAVSEYMDIMDALLELGPSASGQPSEQPEEDGMLQPQQEGLGPDPELLSYLDQLCSQDDFVTKVETIIHPRFLEELLSPNPQLDLMALAEELDKDKEEGLNPDQVVDKNLWPLKTDGTMREKPRPATPLLEASTSDSRALQGTQRDDRAPSPGLSAETSAQSMSCWKPERCVVPDTRLSMHKDNAGFSGDKTCPLLGDIRPTSPRAPSTQVPKAARASQGQCSVEEPPPVVDLTGEDDEELPSLAFFLDSQHHLLPLRLAQSQVSAEDLPCPAPGKPGRAHKPTSNLGRAFTGPPPPATNSKKQALLADPGPRLNKPCPRAGSKASAEQAPALESVPHCQAHKRKADSWGDINKKMRY
ncbi:NUT family member 2G-like [Ochotona curzoniae]|uniref:NUT family member 2G-like n=1 Tax=Ochotona curzoniae TaxID=130825 RepID=UPI001B3505D3|nr:NUT family member 2G-like [Ochotona curzoniae]